MDDPEWKHSDSVSMAERHSQNPGEGGDDKGAVIKNGHAKSPNRSSDEVDYGGINGLEDFFRETTLHGVHNLFRGATASKVIWLLGVLTCLAGFLYFFITASIDYLDYPSNTKVEILTFAGSSGLPVPVISICNTNIAQLSSVNLTADPKNVTIQANIAFLCAVSNLTDDCPVSAAASEALLQAETRNPQQIFRDIGQPKEDMFLKEIVGRNIISSDQVMPVVTTQGLCNTYNIDGSDIIATTGLFSGRRFFVNINQNQYSAIAPGTSVGVEVYLHNPSEPIVRGQGAIYVGPGQRANIALNPENREFLESPYSKPGCTKTNLNRNAALPYTFNRCQLECKEQIVADVCGCLPFTVTEDTALSANGRRITSYCNASEEVCSVGVLVGNATADFACANLCPFPCRMPPNHYSYQHKLSSDLFPSNSFASALVTVLRQSGLYEGSDGVAATTYMRENFALINVYYDVAAYTSIVEQPAFTLTSLFGSVGGNFGLFLGASMLTLLELAQVLLRVATVKVRQWRAE